MNIPEAWQTTQLGRRLAELYARGLPLTITEPLCYAVVEWMMDKKIMRVDRPMQTNEKQIPHTIHDNESDGDWFKRLMDYRKAIELKPTDTIPLDPYQQSWFDYITGKSDVVPGDVVEKVAVEAEVPF